ncbi:hypothetical protein NEMIN01_0152 [Nematocida minor]|uniref:uncharacterized protein n=1 Tax=Nematocida minor TaxID=1912983 RepID=UPI00221F5472|nr:uncharacterized protein NEMIN01_0048 [Nematocida minor]XP_051332054.1 uncharacterized protein NEMIN01_0152 [Nematocida minor]KAI5188784.1 hypothetical protein NEMIN01_0048 [Nematocida minor]KAI5188888.1 hypothetical protein NEMIN01_0152 [Nematocida minor]
MRKLTLNNHNQIDILGLGTYETKCEEADVAVKAAMEAGYRLYDTAQIYRNEKQVSEAIAKTGVERKEVFITTKVSTENQGYENALASVRKSLKVMEQSYIDLVLIHWPGAKGVDLQSKKNKELRHGTYRALLELQEEGAVRNIGVSNFMQSHLRDLFEEFDKKPQVNQIELSPLCYPKDVVEYCQDNSIVVQSYSTLGRGLLLSDEYLKRFPALAGMKEKGSLANQILKWSMNKDCCVIPKSVHPARIIENFKALDQSIDPEDEEFLDHFPVQERTCWDPNTIA